MPNKENSTLTCEFDSEGVVLSGGETQKVSIACAFARDFDVCIFDEPSSALDPIAEYKLFETMMEAFTFSDALWFMLIFLGLAVLLNLLNNYVSA